MSWWPICCAIVIRAFKKITKLRSFIFVLLLSVRRPDDGYYATSQLDVHHAPMALLFRRSNISAGKQQVEIFKGRWLSQVYSSTFEISYIDYVRCLPYVLHIASCHHHVNQENNSTTMWSLKCVVRRVPPSAPVCSHVPIA